MSDISWNLARGLLLYFVIGIGLSLIVLLLVQLKNRIVYKVKNKINKKIANIKTKGEVCPKCGGELIMRNGKYGCFIGCSNFPRCRYIRK